MRSKSLNTVLIRSKGHPRVKRDNSVITNLKPFESPNEGSGEKLWVVEIVHNLTSLFICVN